MEMELVSIIIPIYNVEKYLPKCLDSILAQTYSNIEIILVDDGSTDQSGVICDRYAEKEKRLHVSHSNNHGVSEARKAGLKQSTGQYIIFVDADDWVEKNYIETLYVALQKNYADMSVCNYYEEYSNNTKIIGQNGGELQIFTGADAIAEINMRRNIYPFLWNKMFRREYLNELADSVPVIIGEDYTIVLKTLSQMKKVVLIPMPLYHYNQRNNSVCHRGFDTRFFDVVFNYRKIYKFFLNENKIAAAKGVLQFALLEEMYYVVCMSKNQQYNKEFIRMVTKDVRKNLIPYITCKNTPLMFKCCAVACALDSRFLLLGYAIANKNANHFV